MTSTPGMRENTVCGAGEIQLGHAGIDRLDDAERLRLMAALLCWRT